MPREKEYDSSADRQAAYRERKRLEELDKGKPWQGLLGEEREQAIRDFYGYAKSEKRTQAEREAVANRLRNPEPLSLDFQKSFPAQHNDLAPSPAALKRLGETVGSKR